MQVSVENISNVERCVTVTVPSNIMDEAYNAKINQYAKTATLKGFRKGKAPLSIVKKYFSQEARKQILSDMIEKGIRHALAETKLNPINTPKIEPKKVAPDQPFEFTISFEIFPEIGSIKTEFSSVEKLKVDITDEDIKQVIQELLKQHSKWHVVNREVQKKDRVVVDFHTLVEDQKEMENKMQGVPVEIGSNTMIPGFEEGLIGAKVGEKRTLNLQYPDNYHEKEKIGKPVDFEIEVKQIFEAELIELNESFIQKLGIRSGKLEDLENHIRQTLGFERTRIVNDHLKSQIFEQLLEQNPIDVPASLVEREAKVIHDELYRHKEHDHNSHTAQETARLNEIARKRVAVGMLIGEYAKQTNLKPDTDRVSERIKNIAMSYENPPEVVAWLSKPERRINIENQVLEEQVLEKLLETTMVKEKPMSYRELQGIRN